MGFDLYLKIDLMTCEWVEIAKIESTFLNSSSNSEADNRSSGSRAIILWKQEMRRLMPTDSSFFVSITFYKAHELVAVFDQVKRVGCLEESLP